ncbi:MAG TPA: hypothetical protein VNJ70_14740 [Thermoanaerobaculia bacterium]|nr:hypothetical protein [Thermoanaerobaculia bacterium]
MSDTIRAMADQLLGELQTKVEALKSTPQMAEVLALHRALNGLEEVIPRDRTSLAGLFGLGAEAAPAGGRRLQLKPWEFKGLKALDAAKLYLKRAGEPQPIQNIVAAIRDHGGDPGSAESLKMALTRSTLEVVKVGEDIFGLTEHFPHIKRSSRWKGKKGPVLASLNPDDMVDPDEAEEAAEGAESSEPEEEKEGGK